MRAVFLCLILVTACSRPSKEQVVEAIRSNPSLLADAIKKDPAAFKDALKVAQEQLRQVHAREQQEQAKKEQEEQFRNPLQPKLGSEQIFRGADNAKIVIVEYTDHECPYCTRGAQTMKDLLKKYDGKVKVTVKHLPLAFHPNAMPAARYYEAIRLQNPKLALAFHEQLFEKQSELRQKGVAFLDAEAKKLGVKMDRLKTDVKSPAIQKKIDEDMNEAKSFGLRGTPSFVVGGVAVRGALPIDEFGKIIERLTN